MEHTNADCKDYYTRMKHLYSSIHRIAFRIAPVFTCSRPCLCSPSRFFESATPLCAMIPSRPTVRWLYRCATQRDMHARLLDIMIYS